MALFNFAPTTQGKALFADVQAGAVLIPTKFVAGTGNLPTGKNPGDMTGVVTPIKNLEVTKKTRTPDGVCIFGCVFTNEDITEAFYLRELALYARAEYRDEDGTVTKSVPEVCFIYGNAGDTADLYPAYSTDTVVERKQEIASYLGDNVQVDLTLASGIYIAADEKGQPGGVAQHDNDGNIDMADTGGTVMNLTMPVNPGDAVPKSYADQMLPKAGGTMTGPINMNGQRVHTLPNPTGNADAVPYLFAEQRYNAPCNILSNSDFTNPVNRLGKSYYSAAGETIDLWHSYSGGVGIGVEDGCINIRSESNDRGEWYQPIDPEALEVGRTYTVAMWHTDGGITIQQITVGENQIVDGGAGVSVDFAISTISGRTGLFLYIYPGTSIRVKYIALYDGQYTGGDIPKYRPIGYQKELALCMLTAYGIVLREGMDYGVSFPTTGLVNGRLYYVEE